MENKTVAQCDREFRPLPSAEIRRAKEERDRGDEEREIEWYKRVNEERARI